MSVMSIAHLDGEPRAVFSALEHHWRDHTGQEGLLERSVAHGDSGFVVVEVWESEAAATRSWEVIRLAGIPVPDLRRYEVLARTGTPGERGRRSWLELALPDAEAWNEWAAPRDS